MKKERKEYIAPEAHVVELAGKEILQVGSPGSPSLQNVEWDDEEAEDKYDIL